MVQHIDMAVAATDEFIEAFNPIDPEWIARESRERREARKTAEDEAEEYVGSGIRGRSLWA